MAALALDRAVEEIARVELDPGLRRRDFHCPAALRIGEARGELEASAFAIQHEVMVVALAERELRVLVIDARADCRSLAEIEGGALNGRELARRNQRVID